MCCLVDLCLLYLIADFCDCGFRLFVIIDLVIVECFAGCWVLYCSINCVVILLWLIDDWLAGGCFVGIVSVAIVLILLLCLRLVNVVNSVVLFWYLVFVFVCLLCVLDWWHLCCLLIVVGLYFVMCLIIANCFLGEIVW